MGRLRGRQPPSERSLRRRGMGQRRGRHSGTNCKAHSEQTRKPHTNKIGYGQPRSGHRRRRSTLICRGKPSAVRRSTNAGARRDRRHKADGDAWPGVVVLVRARARGRVVTRNPGGRAGNFFGPRCGGTAEPSAHILGNATSRHRGRSGATGWGVVAWEGCTGVRLFIAGEREGVGPFVGPASATIDHAPDWEQ